MSEVETTEIHSYPMARSCPLRPPGEYEQLREARPVARHMLPSGRPVWLITSHELARRALADPRISSDRTHPGFPLPYPIEDPEALRGLFRFSQSLIGLDPPEHTVRRRLIIPEFTVKRVQKLRPRIEEIVNARIDEMLAQGSEADLVQSLALPVPSLALCELLGVPYTDRDFFESRTKVQINHNSSLEERQKANGELMSYLDKLVATKEVEPGDDLLGRLIVKNREAGTLEHGEVVALAALLLIAGYETTANMIGLGVVGLLENPGQLASLMADPSLASQAVDELLRYFSISDTGGSRVALADVEIGGETIPAGEGVMALSLAGNWDPAAFPAPEKLDIKRDVRQHMAFGHGPHQCIGQNLAKMELEVTLTTLFRRIPTLRLAVPAGELPYKGDANTYGVYELPVVW
ncbi:cytochrome P450 [Streptomyces platensis]|uniref:cytochrome P450 n=1 Tax=Streptomyces platensis TaxID=58346 RepID=UPI002E104563|nr:cytochrome P450 [Streptomyces platensis]WTI56075.1 cytochrome P450 [Streptomyces platensis]WUB78404.1 cytochrome P450 [Streptomyces platensis]